jgi:hypothetical protein
LKEVLRLSIVNVETLSRLKELCGYKFEPPLLQADGEVFLCVYRFDVSYTLSHYFLRQYNKEKVQGRKAFQEIDVGKSMSSNVTDGIHLRFILFKNSVDDDGVW